MKKILMLPVIIILLLTIFLSGCQEQEATVSKTFRNINFDSDVLLLVDNSLDIEKRDDEIYFVEVALYFKNNLNEIVNVTYIVDFCDTNDNVIYSTSLTLAYIPPNHKYTLPDTFSYGGKNVEHFDHININIVDYEIIK